MYVFFIYRSDRWFPSSKTCIHCGYVHKELKLNDRTYICPKCGHMMDRDEQAAKNLRNDAFEIFLKYNTQLAEKAA